jgi:hypothetical protein
VGIGITQRTGKQKGGLKSMNYKLTRKDIMGELQTVKEVEISDVKPDTAIKLDFVYEYLKPDRGILIDKSPKKDEK